MKMGAGMAKFICKEEVVTIADCDEYCHYVAGYVGLGLSKLFHASGKEDMFPESTSNSMGLFLHVNCLAFNPFNEWALATGSTDKTVKLLT